MGKPAQQVIGVRVVRVVIAWVSGICGKDGGGTDIIRGWGYVVEDEKSAGIMKG